jgi:hypothetical protein
LFLLERHIAVSFVYDAQFLVRSELVEQLQCLDANDMLERSAFGFGPTLAFEDSIQRDDPLAFRGT